MSEKASWLSRLKAGLSKSTEAIGTGITQIFTHKKLDDAQLEALEELLIRADVGAKAAASVIENFRAKKFGKEISPEEIRVGLAEELEALLMSAEKPLLTVEAKPFVILVSGVNGVGKTTTIGKLAQRFKSEGKSVMLAAADTFRAAAVEQLTIWGERTGSPVIAKEQGADPASVAFEAIAAAKAQGIDVLFIDTAGRLQNRTELMAELQKIVKVIQKHDAGMPHAALLVLDATTGQNALSQVEIFKGLLPISGLIVTKLDGTAKGGVTVAFAQKFGLPIHFIGVGEQADDLQVFKAKEFARNLVG